MIPQEIKAENKNWLIVENEEIFRLFNKKNMVSLSLKKESIPSLTNYDDFEDSTVKIHTMGEASENQYKKHYRQILSAAFNFLVCEKEMISQQEEPLQENYFNAIAA